MPLLITVTVLFCNPDLENVDAHKKEWLNIFNFKQQFEELWDNVNQDTVKSFNLMGTILSRAGEFTLVIILATGIITGEQPKLVELRVLTQ